MASVQVMTAVTVLGPEGHRALCRLCGEICERVRMYVRTYSVFP